MPKGQPTTGRLGSFESIRVARLIEAHADLFTDQKTGRPMMRYKEGWSDDRVAEEVAPSIGFRPRIAQITKLRTRAIGATETAHNFGSKGPFSARLARIEDELIALRRDLDDTRQQAGLPKLGPEEHGPSSEDSLDEDRLRVKLA